MKKNCSQAVKLITIIMLLLFSGASAKAKELQPVPPGGTAVHIIHLDNQDGIDVGGNQEEKENQDEKIETSPFIQQALLSIDENTAAKEKTKSYVKNFMDSTATIMTDGLNLFDPGSVMMSFINFFTKILEMLGVCITLLVMLLYNVASASFINTIVGNAFDSINQIVFQWDNPNGWIYKILILFAAVTILYRIITRYNKIRSPKEFLNIIFSVVCSCIFIYAVGRYGRPLIQHVESMATESITQTFSFNGNTSDPMEIQNKELLFETLQMQSFRVRHFGVADASLIPAAADGVSGEERVNELLNNPSTDTAVKEYEERGNNQISHNIGSCLQVILESLIFLVHRFLLGIIFSIGCLILLMIGLLKEILLGLAVYQLMLTMTRRTSKAFTWFVNRLQWSLLSIVSYVLFNSFLVFIQITVAKVTSYGAILVIPVDLVLILIIWMGKAYLPLLIEKFRGEEGDKVKETMREMFQGTISPASVYNTLRSRDAEGSEQGEEDDQDNETSGSSSVLNSLMNRSADDLSDTSDSADAAYAADDKEAEESYESEQNDLIEHMNDVDEESDTENPVNIEKQENTDSEAEEDHVSISQNQEQIEDEVQEKEEEEKVIDMDVNDDLSDTPANTEAFEESEIQEEDQISGKKDVGIQGDEDNQNHIDDVDISEAGKTSQSKQENQDKEETESVNKDLLHQDNNDLGDSVDEGSSNEKLSQENETCDPETEQESLPSLKTEETATDNPDVVAAQDHEVLQGSSNLDGQLLAEDEDMELDMDLSDYEDEDD